MVKRERKRIDTHGFLIKRHLLTPEECEEVILCLEGLKPKLFIPHSEIPWGYGNLLSEDKLKRVRENDYIKALCEEIFGPAHTINHIVVNNKAPWIGPSGEWHQEIFNVDTYAPGANQCDESWKDFLQIYIALDKQTVENGCLRILPGSHKYGVLPHQDMVNQNYSHKRKISSVLMTKLYKECGIKNVELSPGDALFFNHRLVHGSPSNASPLERRSIVMQVRKKFIRDTEIFDRETKYRKNFVLKTLQTKIDSLKGKNIYADFRPTEKE